MSKKSLDFFTSLVNCHDSYLPIFPCIGTFCIQIVCTMPVSLTKTKETQFTFKSDTSSTYLFSDEAQVEKSTPKRQHSAPEYLERRKQEKIRRKSELCLLKNRFQPRVLRKSDVGTTAKSQQEIRRSILMQENKNEGDKAQNVRLFSCSVMPAFTREKSLLTPRIKQGSLNSNLSALDFPFFFFSFFCDPGHK